MADQTSSKSSSRATGSRKAEHLRINVEQDVSAKGVTSGFEAYRFVPQALPEIDFDQVSVPTKLFGRDLSAPILISCMTGGVPEAAAVNRTLAEVAQELRLPLGLGSGRALLEDPKVLDTYDVRDVAPDVPLLCNLGAVQLNRGVTVEDCRRLVRSLHADALVLHVNALQEALQLGGDTNFAGLLGRIAELCRELGVPVIVKEVGWGLAPDVVLQLLEAGVAAVDVAGAGGTSWSEVERHRLGDDPMAQVAAAFADWGLPTAQALAAGRKVAPDALIFASGGIRSGVDVAKAIALGADMVGVAGPVLRRAVAGVVPTLQYVGSLIRTLRTVMFCIGAVDLAQLRATRRLVSAGPPSARAPRFHLDHLRYATAASGDYLDITGDVAQVVGRSGVREGLALVYSNHTTAAVRLNENEPLLHSDFDRMLRRLAPEGPYDHDDRERRLGVEDDEAANGSAHCQQLLLSSSETIPVVDGKLGLGPWQRVLLLELDAARDRTVTVQVLGS